ncbi:MAG TPA: TIGR02449 family protein [Sedimenticola thiotaurini]|uniref:TIGR02449 family protein n=1 Tax=Sedimenticola thiotaurini TaxID=1543721 RepID=A0A831RKS5_9GAMM|nr:TIGR02449 family protein [Sedimenticola thiotaurini]
MSSEDRNRRTEQDLEQLEGRLDELIGALQQLREENRLLRSREEELVAERAGLIEKTELARNRVESMIMRLKSMETNL